MAPAHPDENFYERLPARERFEDLSENANYTQVPSSWTLILTDVRGSTRAIREGRYKDVNTLGAASIAAARRALPEREFPFVFGGDGATLLVPGHSAPGILAALAGLRLLASQKFGMELRVGSVEIAEIEKWGASIEVAKYAVSKKCLVAALRGEGLRMAEERFKLPQSPLEYRSGAATDPDLGALSCRWKPFQTRHGKILALILEARTDSGHDPSLTYQRIFKKLSRIFPDGMDQANPARAGLRGYRPWMETLRDETRYQHGRWSLAFARRLLETLVAGLLFNWNAPVPALRRYVRDTPAHCDFRKIDHAFRAVLDCNTEQARAIEELLAGEHASGTIHFGMHESGEALMTCLVEGLGSGEHLHFIDAAGGGYAVAAARLKARKTESPGRNSPGTFQI
jgi:hypothetical protein